MNDVVSGNQPNQSNALGNSNGTPTGRNLTKLRTKRAIAKKKKSTTDIPEEREVGEDVTTDKYGRKPSSPMRL